MKIEKGSFINDFINKNLRQYSIPVYQRNYEWSSEQCEKLFDDIIQAHKLDRYHFTGSVVYELLKTENKIDYYVIIDGQQRLTTIYILLKSLIDVAEAESEKAELLSLLFNEDKFKKYNIDDSSKLKLKPVKSDNQQLMLLMSNKIGDMDKSSGIYQNYDLFCKLAKKALTEDADLSIEKIYDGIEHLTCAMIKLEDEEKGKEQEIFERINSTGVPLSLADKIRNFVLMTDVEQDRLYEDYWLKVEQILTKEQLMSFFLDFLNFKIEGFAKEADAYDVFKNLFRSKSYTNEGMLKEILHYSTYYHAFLYGDAKYSKAINDALKSLQKLKQTTVFLFLFSVFDDYDDGNGVLSQNELEKLLVFLQNYSIRRLVCEVGSNSLRGLYKTLYSRIFADAGNKQYYYDAVVSFFMQLTSKDALPSDLTFTTALKQNNLYKKNALCKYLLISLENKGKEKIASENLSIEHIMPQNKNISTAWQKMLGADWESDWNKYLHTLGNLTLTGYNSELGDKPFAEKLKMLNEAETKIVSLNKDVISLDVWDASAINSRAERLSKEIAGLFAIKAPSKVIEFNDPRYHIYSCNTPDDATNKTPNYYVLCGERVAATNFAYMLRSVVDKLYELDSSIIQECAKNNEPLVAWSKNIMFSYDKNIVSGDTIIGNSGIYESSGFSAAHIMYIIQALLDKYELDYDDFEYSARLNKSAQEDVE